MPYPQTVRLRHYINGHNKPEFTAALDKLGIRYKAKRIGSAGQGRDWDCFELVAFDDDPTWPILRDLTAVHRVRVLSGPTFSKDDLASAA